MSKRFMTVFAVSVLLLTSVAAFAQPADPPGNSGNAPGQQETTPGNSENAPGQQEDGPGNSENAPGQQEDGPGNSENAPGQQDDGPGNSESAPGQQDDGPGNSDAAHACQQDGFLNLAPSESPTEPFENTGDCVSYAAQGGELVELEGAVEGSPEAEVEEDIPVASPDSSPAVGTPVSDGPGNSEAAKACQGTGYLELAKSEAPTEPFKNIGDCVSYAAQGGELVEFEGVPATPDASPEASPAA